MPESAEDFIKNARELPVMPPIATEVMKKAEDPDTDARTIATLISRDAALAVRVLKIANSSFYSMPRKIETIQQGIVILGYSTLRTVVVAAAIKDVFARFGLAERLLWEHGIAAAAATTLLAERLGGISKDEAFVGGLLHDMGKLVMHSLAENEFQEVMKVVYAGEKDAIDAETEVFGFDHAEVGRILLTKWGLPEQLASAVGAHHCLDKADDAEGGKPLAALVQVADRMCLREGIGRRKSDPEIAPWACPGAELLGFAETDFEDLTPVFLERCEQEQEVFG
jgi:putative nucleotidyltransferase with HDIG domain